MDDKSDKRSRQPLAQLLPVISKASNYSDTPA